jgi:hypothetical protein
MGPVLTLLQARGGQYPSGICRYILEKIR